MPKFTLDYDDIIETAKKDKILETVKPQIQSTPLYVDPRTPADAPTLNTVRQPKPVGVFNTAKTALKPIENDNTTLEIEVKKITPTVTKFVDAYSRQHGVDPITAQINIIDSVFKPVKTAMKNATSTMDIQATQDEQKKKEVVKQETTIRKDTYKKLDNAPTPESIPNLLLSLSKTNHVKPELGWEKAGEYIGKSLDNTTLGIGHSIVTQVADKGRFFADAGRTLAKVLPQDQQAWLEENVFSKPAAYLKNDTYMQDKLKEFNAKYAAYDVDNNLELTKDILTSTVDNMPQMLIGMAFGPTAAYAYVFDKVYSNTRASLLNDRNYTAGQSEVGAIWDAALETGTEWLSGGIPGMGKGVLTKGLQNLIMTGAKKALPKIARDATVEFLVGKVLDITGEGFEEYLSQAFQDALLNLAGGGTIKQFGADVAMNWNSDESWRAFTIGMMSSLIMQGSNIAAGTTLMQLTKETKFASLPKETQIELISLAMQQAGVRPEVGNWTFDENGKPVQTANRELASPGIEGATMAPDEQGVQKIIMNTASNREFATGGLHEIGHTLANEATVVPVNLAKANPEVKRGTKASDAVVSSELDQDTGEVVERTLAQEKELFVQRQTEIDGNKFDAAYDRAYELYKKQYNLPDNDTKNRSNPKIIEEMFVDYFATNATIEGMYRMLNIAPKAFDQLKRAMFVMGTQMAGSPAQQYAVRMQSVFEHAFKVKAMANELTNQTLEKLGYFSQSTRNLTPLAKQLYYNTQAKRYESTKNAVIQNASNAFTRNGVTTVELNGQKVTAKNPRFYEGISNRAIVDKVLDEFAGKKVRTIRNIAKKFELGVDFHDVLRNSQNWLNAKKSIAAELQTAFGITDAEVLIEEARKEATISADNGFQYSFDQTIFNRALKQLIAIELLHQNGYDNAFSLEGDADTRAATGSIETKFSITDKDSLGVPVSVEMRGRLKYSKITDGTPRNPFSSDDKKQSNTPVRLRQVSMFLLDHPMATLMGYTKYIRATVADPHDVYVDADDIIDSQYGRDYKVLKGRFDAWEVLDTMHENGYLEGGWPDAVDENDPDFDEDEDNDGEFQIDATYLPFPGLQGGATVNIPYDDLYNHLSYLEEELELGNDSSTTSEYDALQAFSYKPFDYPGVDGSAVTKYLLEYAYDSWGRMDALVDRGTDGKIKTVYVANGTPVLSLQDQALPDNVVFSINEAPDAEVIEYTGVYEEPTEPAEFYMEAIKKSWMPGFTSAMFEVLKQKMPNRASVRDTIRIATNGTSKDEYEWTGLQEYLESLAPDLIISKASVFKVMSENPLDISVKDLKEGSVKYRGYSFGGNQNYTESIVYFKSKRLAKSFTSNHYGEYAMIHIRHYTLKDEKGNDQWLLEEWQSDWHQQGRDRGYDKSNESAALKRKSDALLAKKDEARLNMTSKLAKMLPKNIERLPVFEFNIATGKHRIIFGKTVAEAIADTGYPNTFPIVNNGTFVRDNTKPDQTKYADALAVEQALHQTFGLHDGTFARDNSTAAQALHGVLVCQILGPNRRSTNEMADLLFKSIANSSTGIKGVEAMLNKGKIHEELRATYRDYRDISDQADAARNAYNNAVGGHLIADAPYKNSSWADLAMRIMLAKAEQKRPNRIYLAGSTVHTSRWGGTSLTAKNALIARNYEWKYDKGSDNVKITSRDYSLANYTANPERAIDAKFEGNTARELGVIKSFQKSTPDELKVILSEFTKNLSNQGTEIADAMDMNKVYDDIKKGLAAEQSKGSIDIEYPEYKWFYTNRAFGFQGFYDQKLFTSFSKMMRKYGVSAQKGYLSGNYDIVDSRAVVEEPVVEEPVVPARVIAPPRTEIYQAARNVVLNSFRAVFGTGTIEYSDGVRNFQFTQEMRERTLNKISEWMTLLYTRAQQGESTNGFAGWLQNNATSEHYMDFANFVVHSGYWRGITDWIIEGLVGENINGTEATPRTMEFYTALRNYLYDEAVRALGENIVQPPAPKPVVVKKDVYDIAEYEKYPDPRANVALAHIDQKGKNTDIFNYFQMSDEIYDKIKATPQTLFSITERYDQELVSALQVRLEARLNENTPAKDVLGIVNNGRAEEAYWSGMQEWLEAMPGDTLLNKAEVMEFFNANAVQIRKTTYGDNDRYGYRPQYSQYNYGKTNAREFVYQVKTPLMNGNLMPSFHWENSKNVFAHVRVSDLGPGRLLIEEIQSDVHQLANRQKRYGTEGDIDRAEQMGAEMDSKRDAVINEWFGTYKEEHGMAKDADLKIRLTVNGTADPFYGTTREQAAQLYLMSEIPGAEVTSIQAVRPGKMDGATTHDLQINYVLKGIAQSIDATEMAFANQLELNKIIPIDVTGFDRINNVLFVQPGTPVSPGAYYNWYKAAADLFTATNNKDVNFAPLEMPYRKETWWEFGFREVIKTAVTEGYNRVYVTRGILHALRFDDGSTKIIRALKFVRGWKGNAYMVVISSESAGYNAKEYIVDKAGWSTIYKKFADLLDPEEASRVDAWLDLDIGSTDQLYLRLGDGRVMNNFFPARQKFYDEKLLSHAKKLLKKYNLSIQYERINVEGVANEINMGVQQVRSLIRSTLGFIDLRGVRHDARVDLKEMIGRLDEASVAMFAMEKGARNPKEDFLPYAWDAIQAIDDLLAVRDENTGLYDEVVEGLVQLRMDLNHAIEAVNEAIEGHTQMEDQASFAQEDLLLAMEGPNNDPKRSFLLPYFELNDAIRDDIVASGTPMFSITDLTPIHKSKLLTTLESADFPERIKFDLVPETLKAKGVKQTELEWFGLDKVLPKNGRQYINKAELLNIVSDRKVYLSSATKYSSTYQYKSQADQELRNNRIVLANEERSPNDSRFEMPANSTWMLKDVRELMIYEQNERSKTLLGNMGPMLNTQTNYRNIATPMPIVTIQTGVGIFATTSRWNAPEYFTDKDTFLVGKIRPYDTWNKPDMSAELYKAAPYILESTINADPDVKHAIEIVNTAAEVYRWTTLAAIKTTNGIAPDNEIKYYATWLYDPDNKYDTDADRVPKAAFDHEPTAQEVFAAMLEKTLSIKQDGTIGISSVYNDSTQNIFRKLKEFGIDPTNQPGATFAELGTDENNNFSRTKSPGSLKTYGYSVPNARGNGYNNNRAFVNLYSVKGDQDFMDTMALHTEPRGRIDQFIPINQPQHLESIVAAYNRLDESKTTLRRMSFGGKVDEMVVGPSAFWGEQYKVGVREAFRQGVLSGQKKVAFMLPVAWGLYDRDAYMRQKTMIETKSNSPYTEIGSGSLANSWGSRRANFQDSEHYGNKDQALDRINGLMAKAKNPVAVQEAVAAVKLYFETYIYGLGSHNINADKVFEIEDTDYNKPQFRSPYLSQLNESMIPYLNELLEPYGTAIKFSWVGREPIKSTNEVSLNAWYKALQDRTAKRFLVATFEPTEAMIEDIAANGVPLFSITEMAKNPVAKVDTIGQPITPATLQWLQDANRKVLFDYVELPNGKYVQRPKQFYHGSPTYTGGYYQNQRRSNWTSWLAQHPEYTDALPWLKNIIFLSDTRSTAQGYSTVDGITYTQEINDAPFRNRAALDEYIQKLTRDEVLLRSFGDGQYKMIVNMTEAVIFKDEADLLKRAKFVIRSKTGEDIKGTHAGYVNASEVIEVNRPKDAGLYPNKRDRFFNAKFYTEVEIQGFGKGTDGIVKAYIAQWYKQAMEGKPVSEKSILFWNILDTKGRKNEIPSQVLVVFNNQQWTPVGANPRSADEQFSIRSFPETALDTGILRPIVEIDLEDQIREGKFNYQPHTDKASWNHANARISKDGPVTKEKLDASYNDFNMMIESGRRMEKDDLVMGELLIGHYSTTEFADSNKVMDLITSLAVLGTELGRQVQALNMIRRLGPQGQLMMITKAVQRIEGLYTYEHKAVIRLTISEELVDQLMKASGQKEIDIVIDNIKQDLANQMPATWAQKIDAWRYLAMLGNPRTHIRNILGNTFFVPMAITKDLVATLIEASVAGIEIGTKKDGRPIHLIEQRERTHAILNRFNEKDQALRAYAEMHWVENKTSIMAGGKYDFQRDIREKQMTFKTRWLEAFRKFNFDLLEAEDAFFLHKAFVRNMAQFMKARGWTIEQMTDRRLQLAQNFAIDEAKKLTFRDASQFANTLNYIERTNKAAAIFIKAVLPFKKTPINIMKRGIEYSPVSLLTTIPIQAGRLKRGEINTSEFIDTIAAGLTGTGVVLLGAWLYALGILKVDTGDPDREKEYKKSQGQQLFSIQWGDQSYTIDWIVPLVMPLFMGAQLAAYMEQENNSNPLYFAPEIMVKIFDPVFELTMLQGLTDTIQSFNTSPAAMAGEALTTAGTNLVGQFFPTLGAQIARTIDPIRRSTRAPKDSPYNPIVESLIRRLMNKIPGLSQYNEPMIDIRGEVITQDANPLVRALLNFASPGYYAKGTTNPIDAKIMELYDRTKDAALFPRLTPSTFTNGGETYILAPDETVAFAKEIGTTSYKLLDRVFNSGYYKQADDEVKTKLVTDAYEYGYYKAKDAILIGRGVAVTDKWYLKIKGASQEGISPTDYLIAKSTYDTMTFNEEETTKKDAYAMALVASGYKLSAIKYLMVNIGQYTVNEAYEEHLNYLLIMR